MNLIDTFERVYIINLPERKDRRDELAVELTRLGKIIDGDRIRLFPAIRPQDAGTFPSIGTRGCFMSHRAVIKEALDDGLKNVLILEDDLTFDPAFTTSQEHLCATLNNESWSFAYLGHVDPNFQTQTKPVFEYTEAPQVTLHCYALNHDVFAPLYQYLSDCLERPLGHPLGSQMHVDGAYSLFRGFNPEFKTLICNPSLGHQRSSRSDIAQNRWFDTVPIIRTLSGFLRQLKNRYAHE